MKVRATHLSKSEEIETYNQVKTGNGIPHSRIKENRAKHVHQRLQNQLKAITMKKHIKLELERRNTESRNKRYN